MKRYRVRDIRPLAVHLGDYVEDRDMPGVYRVIETRDKAGPKGETKYLLARVRGDGSLGDPHHWATAHDLMRPTIPHYTQK